MTLTSLAGAETPRASPIDYPLNPALGRGGEQVQVRGQGDRSDRWVNGNYASVLSVWLPGSGDSAAAVVICPGGGYGGLSYDKEGTFIAMWMNARGVAAGVLKYRTGGGAHQHPAPGDDVQFALQTMRANASKHRYPADKIGVMGFSAGGHLAATAATQFKQGGPLEKTGLAERFSSRPDFAILIYPVISMRADATHGGSRRNLLGKSPSEEQVRQMSADEQITARTPPTFLVHASDDHAVPVENSLRFYCACIANKVPAELHLFEEGGHGFGMWKEDTPVENWPMLLQAWMRRHELLADSDS